VNDCLVIAALVLGQRHAALVRRDEVQLDAVVIRRPDAELAAVTIKDVRAEARSIRQAVLANANVGPVFLPA